MTIIKIIWSWISTFGIAFALALFISIFIVQPYKVEGHSMDPTLHDQERLLVSKLPHAFSTMPEYGDILIIDSRIDRKRSFKDDVIEFPVFQFLSGTKDHVFYVKRLIGKPGDVLEFKDHIVYRNGVALNEPYIKETMNYSSDKKWVVPEEHIFVMGDNRNNSNDSRSIGFIPIDHSMGKKIL
jgi:signal peptidase I